MSRSYARRAVAWLTLTTLVVPHLVACGDWSELGDEIRGTSAALTYSSGYDAPEPLALLEPYVAPSPLEVTALFAANYEALAPEPGAATSGSIPSSSSVGNDGTFHHVVPLRIPEGVNGTKPQLALSYSSRSGSGSLGVGWSLGGLSKIERCKKVLATEEVAEQVEFENGHLKDSYCLDGRKLMLASGLPGHSYSTYRTEVADYSRIVLGPLRNGKQGDFTVEGKDGTTRRYEAISQHQRIDRRAENTSSLSTLNDHLAWHLTSIEDESGNEIFFNYDDNLSGASRPHEPLPTSISYANGSREIRFFYHNVPSTGRVERCVSGVCLSAPPVLDRIEVHVNTEGVSGLQWQYRLAYDRSAGTLTERLASLEWCSASNECLPKTEFSWQTADLVERSTVSNVAAFRKVWDSGVLAASFGAWLRPVLADFNGDGRADLLYGVLKPGHESDRCSNEWGANNARALLRLGKGVDFDDFANNEYFGAPIDVSEIFVTGADDWEFKPFNSRFGDFDADGATDILAYQADQVGNAGGFQLFQWDGDGFSPAAHSSFNLPLQHERVDTGDANGDGISDLWIFSFTGGGSPALARGWNLRRTFPGTTNGPSLGSPEPLYFVDPGGNVPADPDAATSNSFSLLDVDGDGRFEMAATNGPSYGTFGIDQSSLGLARIEGNWHVPVGGQRWVAGDFNGDGLEDVVSYANDDIRLHLNSGRGFLAGVDAYDQTSDGISYGPNELSLGDNSVRAGDFNGDGRADLLLLAPGGTVDFDPGRPCGSHQWGTSYDSPEILLSQGTSFRRYTTPASVGFFATTDPRDAPLDTHGWSGNAVGDVDGDGVAEVLLLERPGSNQAALRLYASTYQPVAHPYVPNESGGDLLVRIESGASEPETVTYGSIARGDEEYFDTYSASSSCQWPQKCAQNGLTVVRRYRGPDSGYRSWRYRYEDGRSDLGGRGFIGFRCITRQDIESGQVVKTCFDNETRSAKACPGWIYPFASVPKNVEVRTPIVSDRSEARVVRTDYEWRNPRWMNHAVYSVELDKKTVRVFEGPTVTTDFVGASKVHRDVDLKLSSELSYTYDSHGFPTQEHEVKSGNSESTTTRIFRNFRHLTGDFYKLGLVTREETQREGKGANMRKRVVEYDYDTRGRLTYRATQKGITDQQIEEFLGRTTWGGVESIEWRVPDRATRETQFFYDATNVFVRTIFQPRFRHASRVGIHPALGMPIITRDPNGVTDRMRYDFTGRRRVSVPADGPVTWTDYGTDDWLDSLGFDVPDGYEAVRSVDETGTDSIFVLDREGRLQQTLSKHPDDSWTQVDRDYDDRGRLVEQSLPYESTESPDGYATLTYDGLDRVSRTTNPDGTFASVTYPGFFRTRVTDEEGRVQEQRVDVDGLLSKAVEFGSGGEEIATTYAYYPFGELKSLTYASGARSEYEVDDLGRRTKTTDPDSGVELAWYDGFGQPRLTKHGGRPEDNGNLIYTTTHDYDAIGRLIGQNTTCAAGNDCRGEERKFTWDIGDYAAERLVRAESVTDGIATTFRYNQLGQLAAQEVFVDGKTYETELDYDSIGQLERVLYPEVSGRARYVASQSYDTTGQIDKVVGEDGSVLWEVLSRAPDGKILGTSQRFAGGSTSVWKGRFDPLTRRLAEADTIRGTPTSGLVQRRFTYEYFDNGLLKKRSEFAGGFGQQASPGTATHTELFGYNSRNQLNGWNWKDASSEFTWSYGFTQDGNMSSATRTVQSGVFDPVADTYVYPSASSARPHAATSVGSRTHEYDKAGRMKRRLRGGTEDLKVSYTAFDLPFKTEHRTTTGATETTHFRYDAFGSRVVKWTATERTVSVGSIYEERTTTSGSGVSTKHAFRAFANGDLVAQSTFDALASTEEDVFVHGDRLGSAATIVGTDGLIRENLRFDPWGKRMTATGANLSTTPVSSIRTGFTGHDHDDELGLIDMGGRLYDPELRRVLTPDPLVSSAGNDGWNPYAYALNNPVTFVDPSGFSACNDVDGTTYCEGKIEWTSGNVTGRAMNAVGRTDSPGAHANSHAQQAGAAASADAAKAAGAAGAQGNEPSIRAGEFASSPVGGSLGPAPGGDVSDGSRSSSGVLAGVGSFFDSITLDDVQLGLSVVGFIPGIGVVADVLNAGISLARGDYLGAALNLLGAIPGIGDAAKASAMGSKGLKVAAEVTETAIEVGVKASSRVLANALEASGQIRAAGTAAHHIVAGAAKKAAEARAVLTRFGVGINNAANGVFLRAGVHARIHTNAYYETVNGLLRQAASREEVLEVLAAIRNSLF